MFATKQTQRGLSSSDAFNGRSNILKVIYDNQIGSSSFRTFKSEARNVKIEQLARSEHFYYEFWDRRNMYCTFLKAFGECKDEIMGVWKYNMSQDFYNFVLVMQFHYNPVEGNEMIEPIFCPMQSGPYQLNMCVTDFIFPGKRDWIIYIIGNTREKGGLIFKQPHEETELAFSHFLYSVAANYQRQFVALGSENRCIMYNSLYANNLDIIELPNMPGNVHSLAFDKQGNVLFCGCDQGQMVCFDMRMNLKSGADKPFTELGVKNVVDVQLLPNEYLMAFSNIDGHMGVIDFRKGGVVFYFPEHKNTLISRKPKVYNELDLICATGDDNVSRLWSVNTGKLLKRIIPDRRDIVTHSCLLTCNRQWYLVEVQNNILYPVLLKE